MAQSGLQMWDQGITIGVLNDSGTTAITAGDIVFASSADDQLGSTIANVKSNYAKGDVKVRAMAWSATGYQSVCGVAVSDIAADGYGTIAMEGVFVHAAQENIEAGARVQGYEGTANKLMTIDVTGSTTIVGPYAHKIGVALGAASGDTKPIMWKLAL